VEWLEVRIVVQNECLLIKSCIEALDGDWQPLVNERCFAAEFTARKYHNFILTLVLRQQSCYHSRDRNWPYELMIRLWYICLKISIIKILSKAVHISRHIVNSLMYIILGCFENQAAEQQPFIGMMRQTHIKNQTYKNNERVTNEILCKTVLCVGSWNPWPRNRKLSVK